MTTKKFYKKLDEPIVVVRVPHQVPATVRTWSTLERWLDEQDDAGFGGWLDEQLEAGGSSSTSSSARRCVERYLEHDGSAPLDATVLADYVEIVGEFAFSDLRGGHLWTIDEAIAELGERSQVYSDRKLKACGAFHQSYDQCVICAEIFKNLKAALGDEWCSICGADRIGDLFPTQMLRKTASAWTNTGIQRYPIWGHICECCAHEYMSIAEADDDQEKGEK